MNEIIDTVVEALLRVPGIRFILGLVSGGWRPLWAALWIAVILYVVNRTLHYMELRRARRQVAEGFLRAEEKRQPEPASSEEAAPTAARDAGRVFTAPPSRGLVVGALVFAAVATLAFAAAMRSRGRVADPVEQDVPPTDADSSFQFRSRGWRAEGGGCVATLAVASASASPRRLTLHVLDSAGAVIGWDALDNPLLAKGQFLEFRLEGVACDRIVEWQVQGDFTKPGS